MKIGRDYDLRERLPGSSAIRAAKQQAGASTVTAEAIGSESAALVSGLSSTTLPSTPASAKGGGLLDP